MRFLIVDGYPEKAREELCCAGVTPAWQLFERMLSAYAPQAHIQVVYPSDPGQGLPAVEELKGYRGVLWTGCNLTIHDGADPRLEGHLELCRRSFQAGVPAFGSCWAIQVAAVVCGGRVEAHPDGREIAVSRKIRVLSDHPMFEGKPRVFDGFTSHLDHVSELPPGAELLASSPFTRVQAMVVRQEGTSFWATQYHTEYTLEDMAHLMKARLGPLSREGFFVSPEQAQEYLGRWQDLARDPERRDLRWQLGLDQDLCDPQVRRLEFANWLRYEVGG